jgi:hypothetical protein
MKLAGVILAALLTAGCTVSVGDGPAATAGSLKRESKSFEKSNVERVQVDLEMGAGELRVEGGSAKLFEGDFAYNVDRFKPEVRYDSSGFRGRLTVKQGPATVAGNVENKWDLKFANDVPLDLKVRCGAGDNQMNLKDMTVRSVEVHLGAGRVEIRLPSKPDKGFPVSVHGGVGEAIIRYPDGVDIEAEAAGGIGEIEARGLVKEGNKWVTPNFGKAKTAIRMEVKGGIGAIRILPAS